MALLAPAWPKRILENHQNWWFSRKITNLPVLSKAQDLFKHTGDPGHQNHGFYVFYGPGFRPKGSESFLSAGQTFPCLAQRIGNLLRNGRKAPQSGAFPRLFWSVVWAPRQESGLRPLLCLIYWPKDGIPPQRGGIPCHPVKQAGFLPEPGHKIGNFRWFS